MRIEANYLQLNVLQFIIHRDIQEEWEEWEEWEGLVDWLPERSR